MGACGTNNAETCLFKELFDLSFKVCSFAICVHGVENGSRAFLNLTVVKFRQSFKSMDWGQVLTIIFGIAGFMSIFMFLINKRIDDLREEIKEIKSEIKELKSEMKEIRELLYKVLGAEAKKGD